MQKIPRILGIGTDITSVDRMLKLIQRGPSFEERFLNRILHLSEKDRYLKIHDDDKQKAQFLASRWAFKEAMVKASGKTSLYYPGMYLKKQEDGKPIPTIEGDTNTRIIYNELKVTKIHASISHEDQFAVAFVLLESEIALI